MTKANKIMIVGTLDAIIDTADIFLRAHPQATLQDFINFLRETQIFMSREE